MRECELRVPHEGSGSSGNDGVRGSGKHGCGLPNLGPVVLGLPTRWCDWGVRVN